MCPLALTGFVGLCFLAIALLNAATQTAERMKALIADASLASAEMYHHSQNHNGQSGQVDGMNAMMAASRKFRVAQENLSSIFLRDGRPEAAIYDAPLTHLAVVLRLGRPPVQVESIWGASENGGSIDRLLKQQLSVCRELCMTPGLTPEQREAQLDILNKIAIETLMPRLRELRVAASAWKADLTFYTRLTTALACFGLICAILFTRFRIVAPLLSELDSANEALSGRNEKLEQMVAARTVALSKALEDATSAHETRTRFLASVNHEMRTPLNGVLGVAALLERTDLTEQQRNLTHTIAHSGKTLVRLIDDVLDYVSLSTGQMQLDVRPVNLMDLMTETLKLLRPIAGQKGLDLRFEGSAGLQALVLADAERLAQIVNNLVGNAIKFTAAGHVSVRFKQRVEGDVAHVVVEVVDTGVGISGEKKAQLFVPFERQSFGVPSKGSGLGLAITRKLVSQMGGILEIESEPEMGTQVVVRLPFPVAETTQHVKDAA